MTTASQAVGAQLVPLGVSDDLADTVMQAIAAAGYQLEPTGGGTPVDLLTTMQSERYQLTGVAGGFITAVKVGSSGWLVYLDLQRPDKTGSDRLGPVFVKATGNDLQSSLAAPEGQTILTAFPANPTDGQYVFRSDLREGFHYAASVGSGTWLGERRLMSFASKFSTNVGNTYGMQIDGISISQDDNAPAFGFPTVLEEVHINNGNQSMTADVEFYAGATLLHTEAFASENQRAGLALGLSVASGARISGQIVLTSGTLERPMSLLVFRRVAT